MIIDERTYTIKPTRVNDYLDLYEKWVYQFRLES